jgi:hypothetical protein
MSRETQPNATQRNNQETVMNTQISTKLAALALALMMNSLMLGGIAFLFSGPTASIAALI